MLGLWWDEGWLRDVHTSTPKQSLEACVEPFPAEMCVTDCYFLLLLDYTTLDFY